MNNLCFYNSQSLYPQNSEFNSFKHQQQQQQHINQMPNNQMNMIEMINLLNKSQISQQQNLIDIFIAKNQIQQNTPAHQFAPYLDLNNNNYHSDDILRKELEQSRHLQRKIQQQQPPKPEPVSKEYILSQLKEQQKRKTTKNRLEGT